MGKLGVYGELISTPYMDMHMYYLLSLKYQLF